MSQTSKSSEEWASFLIPFLLMTVIGFIVLTFSLIRENRELKRRLDRYEPQYEYRDNSADFD